MSPKSGRVHYNYAMFLGRSGKVDEAISEFQTATKHKPDDVDAHYDLANRNGEGPRAAQNVEDFRAKT